MLGVHPNTIRAWTRQGVLPCLRINGRGDRRYRRDDLVGFVKTRAVGGLPTGEGPSRTRGVAPTCCSRWARNWAASSIRTSF